MTKVSEIIPEALQPEVDAALVWFNANQQQAFEVTGILDAEITLSAKSPRDLRLVLCGGDSCQQLTFRVTSVPEGFDVRLADTEEPDSESPSQLQAELDPPPGPRRAWLDSVIPKHKFVVLVFYRGFW